MAKISEIEITKLLFDEGAAPSTPASTNVALYAKADGLLYSKDDAGTETVVSGTGASLTFTAWTPALTASTTNPTLGTGSSAQGRYFQNGKHVRAYGSINFGTSGVAAGSGVYFISVPATMRTPTNADMNSIGMGYLFDSSASTLRVVHFRYTTTTTTTMLNISTNTDVSNGVPWTWAASDALIFTFDYEAA